MIALVIRVWAAVLQAFAQGLGSFSQLSLPGCAPPALIVAAFASGRLPTLELLCHGGYR